MNLVGVLGFVVFAAMIVGGAVLGWAKVRQFDRRLGLLESSDPAPPGPPAMFARVGEVDGLRAVVLEQSKAIEALTTLGIARLPARVDAIEAKPCMTWTAAKFEDLAGDIAKIKAMIPPNADRYALADELVAMADLIRPKPDGFDLSKMPWKVDGPNFDEVA